MTITELIILAADIMDDMQDNDAQIDAPWGQVTDDSNLNIIVGLLLISLKELIEIEGETSIQQNVHHYLLQSISGQQIDINNELISEADYFHMASMKSGSLIVLACLLGAGKINDQLVKKISKSAYYLGVIFQLRNDVSDMKNGFIKSDILLKKRTLPILYYLNTDDEAYAGIQNYYLNRTSKEDIPLTHRDLINEEALLYCSIVEKILLQKYEQVINQFNLSEEDKSLLLSIV